MKLKFLVIEDDDLLRMALAMMLKDLGDVKEAANSIEAKKFIASDDFDIYFIDLDLEEELVGFDLIELVVKKKGHAVVISGREEESYIEIAYNKGCLDYLGKPFQKDGLELVLRRYNFLAKQGVLKDFFTYDYITSDESVVEDLRVIEDIVIGQKAVFLQGPTGTGKTMMAKLLHSLTCEDETKFVHLNCSEIPENLLESELYGYEKGAFSGADRKQIGKLKLADGGTFFLDEIATLPMGMQKKILKVIEEKNYYPLGSTKLEKSNFRLITATCEDIKQMVEDSLFREDLYYRIYGYNIVLKSLRERKDDILLLVKHFLRKGQRRIVLSQDVKNAFVDYSWPGNIRELKKVIEILQAKSFGVINLDDLPKEIRENFNATKIKNSSLKNKFVEIKQSIEPHCKSEVFVNDIMLNHCREHGLKDLIEKVEEQVVSIEYSRNLFKVRPTLNILKLSSSGFYRILNRSKEKAFHNE